MRHAARGFTLLELLISLALLGGIGVIMFGGLWYGIVTWHRSTVFADRAGDGTVVRRALTHLIGHAYPLYVTPPAPAPGAKPQEGGAEIAFSGEPDAMAFLAPTPVALGGGGMTHFDLLVRRHEGGVDLVVRARPELANDAAGSSVVSTVVENAKEIVFSYYEGPVESGRPKWVKKWEHKVMLPKLIRIGIEFSDSKWPDLTIAPRIAFDTGCAFDAKTMGCSGR